MKHFFVAVCAHAREEIRNDGMTNQISATRKLRSSRFSTECIPNAANAGSRDYSALFSHKRRDKRPSAKKLVNDIHSRNFPTYLSSCD